MMRTNAYSASLLIVIDTSRTNREIICIVKPRGPCVVIACTTYAEQCKSERGSETDSRRTACTDVDRLERFEQLELRIHSRRSGSRVRFGPTGSGVHVHDQATAEIGGLCHGF